MVEAGILREDDRVELLDGEIVEMSPIGPPHAGCVIRLTVLLTRRLRDRAFVSVQNPMVLSRWSEPQPDIAILSPRADFYTTAHARPRDVLLAIEVIASKGGYDRTLKLPLYARASVREVWLADVRAKTVDVCTGPALRGYRTHRRFVPGNAITPRAFPRLRFRVADVLG